MQAVSRTRRAAGGAQRLMASSRAF
jgi:hypothetical protein